MPRAAGKLRPRAHVLQQEKPLQREARAPRPEEPPSAAASAPQLEPSRSNRDPAQKERNIKREKVTSKKYGKFEG